MGSTVIGILSLLLIQAVVVSRQGGASGVTFGAAFVVIMFAFQAMRYMVNTICLPIEELARMLQENDLNAISELAQKGENEKLLHSEEVKQLYQAVGQMAATVNNHNEYMEKMLAAHSCSMVFMQGYLDKAVDQRRRAEQSLSEYGNYLIKLLENQGDIVTRFDADLRFKYISPGIEMITGISSDAYIGRQPSEVYGATEQAGEQERNIRNVLLGQEAKTEYMEYKGPSGLTMVLVKMIPEKEADGTIKHVLAIARDITEFRTMQKEIERLDRLHLVGEMAASIGHEVRNPLTTVRGLLQLMAMKEENKQFRDKYQLMIEEIDRANSIITEFLSLAKNKSVVLKECKLDDVIYALLPLLEAEAVLGNKSVSIDLKSHKTIFADDKEIRQLLLNLSGNSLEAMQPGQNLSIATSDTEDQVILVIRDPGKGIPDCVLEKIGTPFVTTKEQGTGLGLPVCYSIAARHKAEIRLETSSEGTSFYISFPQVGTLPDWPAHRQN